MAIIIKSLDKRSGITYVYESYSYWDKEKKQPRSRRTLIGKIDPKTGKIVPTDGRGSRRKKAISPPVVGKRNRMNEVKPLSDYQEPMSPEASLCASVAAYDTSLRIADAFLNLCKRKTIRKITIQDIISESKIARQTFYNHFMDKQDLMNYIYKLQADYSIECFFRKELNIKSSTCLTLHNCLEKREYYIDLANYNTQNNFPDFFYTCTKQFYRDFIIEYYGKDALTQDLESAIEFNCAGARHLFINWIRDGMVETPEHLSDLIINFMPIPLKQKINGIQSI